MYKLKIVVVGPCESGKSTLCNFLSDAVEVPISDTYRPTRAVRIVEFEANNVVAGNRHVKADVELWDTSGDVRFDRCWPALRRDAHGVVFVFDPHAEVNARDMDAFYAHFVEKAGLAESQAIVLACVRKDKAKDRKGIRLSSQFSRIPQLEVNMEEEGNRLRSDFTTFISSLLASLTNNRDREEMSIMNSRNN